MKSTSSDRYLELIGDTLDKIMVPALQCESAKASVEILRAMITELRRRERFGDEQLRQTIEDGRLMAARLQSALGDAAWEDVEGVAEDQGCSALSVERLRLEDRIARMANSLSRMRSTDNSCAHQQEITSMLKAAAEWEQSYYSAIRKSSSLLATILEKPASRSLTREKIEAFIQSRHADGMTCSVSTFSLIPGGFSKQTFRVGLRRKDGEECPLIVRKSSTAPFVRHGTFIIRREFELIRDLYASGLPVAQPLWFGSDDAGVDGDFYVMTALPGRTIGSFLGGAATISKTVLLNLAEKLAILHAMSVSSYPNFVAVRGPVEPSVEQCYREQLARWRDYFNTEQHLPSPFMSFLFDWLEQNTPRDQRSPVLVHGDFNIHNVMSDGEAITAILDWESAEFGAPEQDLAWIRPHVSRHIEWAEFVEHYRACGGREIREDNLRFGMVFSLLAASIACNKGNLNLLNRDEDDIRYAMMELGFWPEFMKLAFSADTGS